MAKESHKELTFYIILIIVTIVVMAMMTLRACNGGGSGLSWSNIFASSEARRDTAILQAIQQHSRLYTAETTSRKTITYTSHKQFKVKLGGFEKNVNMPLGKTEAVIPVAVKYKAYIDLDKVTKKSFRVENDTTIFITLPDPVIEETAVSIDHDNEKLKKQWLGKGLTYQEYQDLVRKAKEDAWNELSEDDQRAIIETAKISATELLIPQLRALGYEHIYIDYRKEFTLKQLVRIKD